jgi:hypothetical protein
LNIVKCGYRPLTRNGSAALQIEATVVRKAAPNNSSCRVIVIESPLHT